MAEVASGAEEKDSSSVGVLHGEREKAGVAEVNDRNDALGPDGHFIESVSARAPGRSRPPSTHYSPLGRRRRGGGGGDEGGRGWRPREDSIGRSVMRHQHNESREAERSSEIPLN